MPTGYGDTVYLYFHLAGGIEWCLSDYELLDDIELCDHQVTEKVNCDCIDVTSEIINDDGYHGKLKLIVTDADGNEIYCGLIGNGKSMTFDNFLFLI